MNIVYHRDCMDSLKNYDKHHFDLAIIDPEYGIGENQGQDKSRNINRVDHRNGKPIIIRHKGYAPKNWDKKPAGSQYFEELFRVSKHQIIWGANHFIENLPANKRNSSCWIVWDKVNGDSHFADCELAWTSFTSAVRLFSFMWSGMIQGSLSNGKISEGNQLLKEKRIHPTQKPVQLYKWLLQNYAQQGWSILDTHVGSGSSRIAADQLGFDFTGYEIDADYFAAQEKRYQQHKAQLKLFAT